MTPQSAIDQITVEWSMSETCIIWLRYHAAGNVGEVSLPDGLDQSQRMDGLWQNTCFELFLGEPRTERYSEFNFSPSGNWAAYSFDHYRNGMDPLALAQSPEIYMDFSDTHMALEVTFGLPDIWMREEFDAGLSAVIEMQDGEKSLWALAHPAANPDFHHRDGFACASSFGDTGPCP